MRIGLVLAATLAVVAFPVFSASKRSVPTKRPAAEVAAKATGLEETYAKLCTGATAAANDEACVALKQAMIAKLTGTIPAVAVAPPQQQTTRVVGGALLGGIMGMFGGVAKTAGNGATVAGAGLTRTITAPYGQTTKFELRLVKGELVELEIAVPEGSATAQVCPIPDAFLGGIGSCLEPRQIERGLAVYRHRAAKGGEFQVKVKTKGPANVSYTIRTRAEPQGQAAAMLAEMEKLSGRNYIVSGTLEGLPVKTAASYFVRVPGKSGVMKFIDESGKREEVVYTADPGGNLTFTQSGYTGVMQPGFDGRPYAYHQSGRVGYAVAPDGAWSRTWDAKKQNDAANVQSDTGGYLRANSVEDPPSSDKAVAAMLKAGPGRIAAARAKRFLEWGPYNTLAGHDWTIQQPNGSVDVRNYSWVIPGHILAQKIWALSGLGQAPYWSGTLTHDAKTGVISGTLKGAGGAVAVITAARNNEGEVVTTEGQWSLVYSEVGPGMVSSRWIAGPPGTAIPAPVTYRTLDAAQLASLTQQASANRAAQQAAAAQAAQNSGGFSLGNILQGAQMLQNPNMIDQAFKQGMVQMLNQKAPGLGDIYGAAATPGGLKGAAGGVSGGVNPLTGMRTGGGSSGAGGGPNLAVGSHCPGFTEGNYRSHAFNGGRDQQLYALCGQAFEYYHMYQNAVQQGDPDAGRTYQAHSAAVRQIKQFLAEAQ